MISIYESISFLFWWFLVIQFFTGTTFYLTALYFKSGVIIDTEQYNWNMYLFSICMGIFIHRIKFNDVLFDMNGWYKIDELLVHYQNNQIHRDDGPAMIDDKGISRWYQYGYHHRDDGPACNYNGTEYWYQFGKLHRDDGPAQSTPEGHMMWFQYGVSHRDDGPGFIDDKGNQIWLYCGIKHRFDGPAMIFADGNVSWFWNDEHVTEIEHNQKLINYRMLNSLDQIL